MEIQIPVLSGGVASTWIKVDLGDSQIHHCYTIIVNWPAFGKGALQNSTRERRMFPRHQEQ